MVGPLARALGPGGRLLGIHSCGRDPGLEIVRKVWPEENPFATGRHDVLRALRTELGKEARHFNFNAYSDARAVFRYDMHTLPTEVAESIGTSTLFAAWNAAIYVAQIDDERLARVVGERKYLDATREVLQQHGALVPDGPMSSSKTRLSAHSPGAAALAPSWWRRRWLGAHRPQDAREIAALLPLGTPVTSICRAPARHVPTLVAVRRRAWNRAHIAARRIGTAMS